MVYFDKCDVKINGTGILANSVAISTSNSVSQVGALGYRGYISSPARDATISNISIQYFIDISNDPIFASIQSLKFSDNYNGTNSIPVVVGGLTGQGYIENFSIRCSPNEPSNGSVSFVCYLPISGTLRENSENLTYNATNLSGINHGWVTYVSSQAESITNPTFDLDYVFRAQWNPQYGFKKPIPDKVVFLNAEESISFTKDVFRNINYSGELLKSYINSNESTVKLNRIDLLSPTPNTNRITLDFSNAIVKQNEVTSSVDDIVRIKTTAINKY